MLSISAVRAATAEETTNHHWPGRLRSARENFAGELNEKGRQTKKDRAARFNLRKKSSDGKGSVGRDFSEFPGEE
jgi:hypothetical protein